ncbi:MAG: hypothetical protein RL701_2731, partial [Pseudomonadota bacterium]
LATDQLGSRTTFGVAAVGGAAGLVLAWLATTGMTPDTTQPTCTPAARYSVMPLRGGWIAAVDGEL